MNILKVKQRSVNNKRLFKEIDDSIRDTLQLLPTKWENPSNRQKICDGIEEFLSDFVEQGEIIHQKVICDKRNNKSFVSGKHVVLEIHYKQPHCLNTTVIEYHIAS